MIVFKKLRWQNFLSSGNQFTEIDLSVPGTTLIIGENGAGKSTLLDALTFGLFGKPFRDINKPQLLNTITKKSMRVEVEFSTNGADYVVVRGMRPNVFEIYKNGSLVNQSAETRDYQSILEKQVLKTNFKSFCQVVVLGSASYVPFMKLPTGKRREIVEDILDLQIFTTMNTLLKTRVAKNIENMNDVVNAQKLLDERVKLLNEHMIEVQNSNQAIVEEKIERINSIDTLLDELNGEKTMLEEHLEEAKSNTADENRLLAKISKINEIRAQIVARQKQVLKEILFFEENSTCPTCKQAIDEEHKHAVVSEFAGLNTELDDGLAALLERYEAAEAELQLVTEASKKTMELEMELYRLNSKMSAQREYRRQLAAEIVRVNLNVEDDFQKQMEEIEQQKIALAKTHSDLSEEKLVLSTAAAMLKDGGIKAKIIKQYVPIINRLINKYLSAMDFFVQFELDEEFSETIKSRFRDEFSYGSFSEGEKQKINLSILFAWRAVAKLRNSVSANILIMDEVFDSSLDSNGADYLLNIIRTISPDNNVFVISHKDSIVDKFDRTIKFVKTKNFSTATLV